jgi:hypothetical protein
VHAAIAPSPTIHTSDSADCDTNCTRCARDHRHYSDQHVHPAWRSDNGLCRARRANGAVEACASFCTVCHTPGPRQQLPNPGHSWPCPHEPIQWVGDLLEISLLQVQIDTGRLYAGVAKETLNNEDVRSRLQQVGCKAVTERVDGDRLGNTDFFLATLKTCCTARSPRGRCRTYPGNNHSVGR